ncbi:MAG TPA: hypothetical protein PLU39_17540, partial [Armatimonadota bacterium]|nr:hypothetical protein [Armatimonadota bacterium]
AAIGLERRTDLLDRLFYTLAHDSTLLLTYTLPETTQPIPRCGGLGDLLFDGFMVAHATPGVKQARLAYSPIAS